MTTALTQAYLRHVLLYEPETGDFFRAVKTCGRCVVGAKPQYFKQGYLYIRVGGVQYSAHRLAWLYMTGEWPKDTIDHINGNTKDNRWENLREASQKENSRNRKNRVDSKSGFKGVSWQKSMRKWQARIHLSGKEIHLGYFDAAAEAADAYDDASQKLYGEFGRPNKRRAA